MNKRYPVIDYRENWPEYKTYYVGEGNDGKRCTDVFRTKHSLKYLSLV